jgi:hypothetical protein
LFVIPQGFAFVLAVACSPPPNPTPRVPHISILRCGNVHSFPPAFALALALALALAFALARYSLLVHKSPLHYPNPSRPYPAFIPVPVFAFAFLRALCAPPRPPRPSSKPPPLQANSNPPNYFSRIPSAKSHVKPPNTPKNP